MSESTTQTSDSAASGVVTGCGTNDVHERGPVISVPPLVEYGPNDGQTVGRTQWARDVYAGSAGNASQRRRRDQPHWTHHKIPTRLISRGPPRRRCKHDLPHSSHKSRREAAHVRTNSVLRDRASTPIGNRPSPIAVEARPPVLRVCAGRLVAANQSTVHRASAPARSPVAAGRVRRPGHLRRDQLGAKIIAHGVSGPHIILEGSSTTSTNTLTLLGEGFGRLVLLVVPPCTNPTRAYTAVMTASKPDNVSTPDELLGIGPREAQDRRLAVLAQQRWESEGGALRRLGHERGNGAVVGEIQEVRRAQ